MNKIKWMNNGHVDLWVCTGLGRSTYRPDTHNYFLPGKQTAHGCIHTQIYIYKWPSTHLNFWFIPINDTLIRKIFYTSAHSFLSFSISRTHTASLTPALARSVCVWEFQELIQVSITRLHAHTHARARTRERLTFKKRWVQGPGANPDTKVSSWHASPWRKPRPFELNSLKEGQETVSQFPRLLSLLHSVFVIRNMIEKGGTGRGKLNPFRLMGALTDRGWWPGHLTGLHHNYFSSVYLLPAFVNTRLCLSTLFVPHKRSRRAGGVASLWCSHLHPYPHMLTHDQEQ